MIEKIIVEMMNYFGRDIKRINHALKVYGYSKALTGSFDLTQEIKEIIEITAVLHDIGIHEAERKYNSTAGKYQEIEGPSIAEEIMKKNEILSDIIDRVKYIIGNHHNYSKIDNIDFQIIIEADFIVNAYEDGLNIKQIAAAKEKFFKTECGIGILNTIFN